MRLPADAWLVYLLACADGTLYCGITNNLERRLKAHGRGRVKYTRGRLPVEVAHLEEASDKSAALRAEAAWKRLTRRKKLQRIAELAPKDVRARTCVLSSETVSQDDAKQARRRRYHHGRGAGRRRV
jgi:putative endonuclease